MNLNSELLFEKFVKPFVVVFCCEKATRMTDTASMETPRTMLERDRVCQVPCLARQEMPLVGVDDVSVRADQHATLEELGSAAIADAFGRPHPPCTCPAVDSASASVPVSPPQCPPPSSGKSRQERVVPRRATAAELGIPVTGQGRAEMSARRRQARRGQSSNTPSLKFKC